MVIGIKASRYAESDTECASIVPTKGTASRPRSDRHNGDAAGMIDGRGYAAHFVDGSRKRLARLSVRA
jgi:hypothetical protein